MTAIRKLMFVWILVLFGSPLLPSVSVAAPYGTTYDQASTTTTAPATIAERTRRTYGAGLDEIVQLEQDLDGNGTLEEKYVPLYDDTGNLAAVTGQNGKPIERYAYSPYGEQTILVDSTPPAVEQMRSKDGALWLEMSEEVSSEALAKAVADHTLTLEDLGTQQPLEIQVSQPVNTGRQARRRIAIAVTGTPPAAGAQVKLTIPPAALQDLFLNQPQESFERTFPWPST
jgi:hypothetical protein